MASGTLGETARKSPTAEGHVGHMDDAADKAARKAQKLRRAQTAADPGARPVKGQKKRKVGPSSGNGHFKSTVGFKICQRYNKQYC